MDEISFTRILLSIVAFFMGKFYLDVDKAKKKIEDLNGAISDINTKIEVQRTEFNRHVADMQEIKSDLKDLNSKFDKVNEYIREATHKIKNRDASDEMLIEYIKKFIEKTEKD